MLYRSRVCGVVGLRRGRALYFYDIMPGNLLRDDQEVVDNRLILSEKLRGE